MLHDKQQRTTHFTVPGGGTVMSQEFGTIKLKLWNITKHKYDILTLNNVAYQPESNNLLSLGKLNRQGLHIDTEHYVLYRRMSDATRHDYKILPTENNMLLLEAQSICGDGTLIPTIAHSVHQTTTVTPQSDAPSTRASAPPTVDQHNRPQSEDYKLNAEIFNELNAQFGPFDIELFASDQNNHITNYYTQRDNAFNKTWSRQNCYGNCPYNNETIYKMLQKSMDDFISDNTLSTKYTFILPEWTSAPWYKTFMCYFDVVKRIPKGTPNVFNQPLTGNMEPVPGEEHRSYAGPTPWPVIVIYKDQFTKSNVTDVMLLHLQLGHANIHKLRAAQEHYGTNKVSRTNPNRIPYCRPIMSTDVIYCAACHTAKAKKIALPSQPRRPSIKTEVLDPRLETQTQERAISFGDLVYCDYKYINVDSLSGDRYVLIFIDWSTRYVHSFCTLKRKHAHKLLVNYMTIINNVHQEQNNDNDAPLRNTKLKALHVDQASEFMSNKFQNVCHKQQVKLYSSGSGHHQSNSIAERVIGTLKNMALAMMYTSSSPEREWSLAWDQAVYVYNRLPHKFFKQKHCPLEKYQNLKPDYSRIRIFGCSAYAFIEPMRVRGEININRAQQRTFVGNTSDNTYKLLNRKTGELTTKDTIVKFEQNVNQYAQLINTPDIKTTLTMFEQEALTILPKPYKSADNMLNIECIHDSCIYFDEHEQKYYGMLKVQTSAHGEDRVWIKAIHLISTRPPLTAQGRPDQIVYNTKQHNITHLETYIASNRNEINQYHSIFHYRDRTATIAGHTVKQQLIILTLQQGVKSDFIYEVVITKHTNDHHFRTKPRLIQVTNTQLSEPSDPHVVNMVEGGDASYSPVNDAEEFIYRNLHMGFNIKASIKERCNSICAQPSEDGTHNINPEHSLHNRHNDGARTKHRVYSQTLPTASEKNSRLSGKISATTQHINQLENNINTKYLSYKEPITIKQAIKASDGPQWQTAMEKELQQLDDQNTMEPVSIHDIPKDKNIVKSKFVFKLKLLANGDIDKYKARLVAQGFTQVFGIDYHENFSPTPQIGGVRLVIAFIIHFQLDKASADVSGAFLEATLTETIFMKLPEGISHRGSNYVKLLKSLYGLKQAARDWYLLQDKIIREFDPELKKSLTDACIYYKITKDCIFIISVHVDDYAIGYNNKKYYEDFLNHYRKHVKFTTSEQFDYILQMKLEWSENTVTLSQNRQIQTLCNKFGLHNNVKSPVTPMKTDIKIIKGDKLHLPNKPYAELVCSLLFIARYTRPDILYSVTVLCRYLTCYNDDLWHAALRILKYLQHTTNKKLTYIRQENAKVLEVYCDADWCNKELITVDGKCTSGAAIFFHGNAIDWSCQKQPDVSFSTTEAEYKQLTFGMKQAMYYINLLQEEMKFDVTPVPIHEDNQGAIILAQQPTVSMKSRHIAFRHHYAREQVMEYKRFVLQYIKSQDNCADIFTKPLERNTLCRHRDFIFNLTPHTSMKQGRRAEDNDTGQNKKTKHD